MNLTFNDVMNKDTLSPSLITLRSNLETEYDNSTYKLTGGTSPSDDGFEIQLVFSATDLNAIKSRFGLAVANTTTYITFTADTIQDSAGLSVERVELNNEFSASIVIPDTTSPQLDGFTVDLNEEVLILVFSEVVDMHTFDTSQITLQSRKNYQNATIYNLTGGITFEERTALSVTIELTDPDLNEIKRLQDLLTNRSDSFISITEALVKDTNDNPVVEIPMIDALQASEFKKDMVRPILEYFSLDLNKGVLSLTFDETVNSSTLNISLIVIQNSFNANDDDTVYQLKSGSVSTSTSDLDGDHVLFVNISNSDLNEIKSRLELGTGKDNTFIRLLENAVEDISKNGISEIENGAAIKITNFTEDQNSPELTRFDIDLSNDQITLTFSESVLPETFDPLSLTLLANQSSSIQYQLKSSNTSSPIGPIIVINLSKEDSDAIKSIAELANDNSTTYISVQEDLINDTVSIPVISIPPTEALRTAGYIEDNIPPRLQCTTLDMDDGLLILTFDEPVDPFSLHMNQIILSESNNSNNTFNFTYSSTSSPAGLTILANISNSDLNMVKENLDLARDNTSTYFSLSNTAITDTSGVGVVSISINEANPACEYIADTTKPELDSYDIFMIDKKLPLIIKLYFSESIDIEKFSPTSITLLSSSNISDNGATEYTITSASYTMKDTAVLEIKTTEFDFSGIRLVPPILESQNSTYLSIPDSSFYDIEGNPGIGISKTSALKVSELDVDLTSPDLLEFNLDLNSGELLLTFSQAINPSTTNFTYLTIQSTEDSENISYTLTGGNGTINDIDEPNILKIKLKDEDLNAIKSNRELAISKSTTWISALSGFIKGTTGTPSSLVPITRARPIVQFTPDFTRPALNSFSVYIDSMIVILTFSESVSLSTFEAEQITFQNSQSNPSTEYTLTGGNSTLHKNNVLILVLSEEDQNNLKALTDLFTDVNDTYLSATAQLIEDATGNALVPIRDYDAKKASFFEEDMEQPYLVEFELDLRYNQLLLTFDETVNPETMQVSAITLYNDDENYTINFTLSDESEPTSILTSEVVVKLSRYDAGEIKSLDLCSDADNCFLTHTSELVRDIINRFVIERNLTDILQASDVIKDDQPPVLQSFDIDMETGIVTFSFSEPVKASSINFTAITFQSFYEYPTYEVQLTNGTLITKDDGLDIRFQLDDDDFINIQSSAHICVTKGTCYITFKSGLIEDLAGNNIVGVADGTTWSCSIWIHS